MKKCVLLFSLLGLLIQAFGQHRTPTTEIIVVGKVIDSLGEPLYLATITYESSIDTLHALTSADGSYTLSARPDSIFTLLISMKGYTDYSHHYNQSTNTQTQNLMPIILRPAFGDLDPVTITTVRPVTFAPDTISYHASAFPVRDGSEVEDILKRLPGVEIDANGNVIVQGKKVDHVLVNGKEFFGRDVLYAIKNLPADVVDKLQVIDDYGDKARLTGIRTGNPTKVLNIVLQSNKQNGIFGQMDAMGGQQEKYAEDLSTNHFEGDQQVTLRMGISDNNPTGKDPVQSGGVNYAGQWNAKWKTSGNVTAILQHPRTTTNTGTTNFYPNDTLQQNLTSANVLASRDVSLNTRVEYTPDPQTNLQINVADYLQNSTNQQTTQFTTSQTDSGFTKTTRGTTQLSNPIKNDELRLISHFDKVLPESRQRISVDAIFQYKTTCSFSDNQTSSYVSADGTMTQNFLHDQTNNKTRTLNINISPTYFFPVGLEGFLELGYQFQSSASLSSILTDATNVLGQRPQPVDSLSQRTILNGVENSFHGGYATRFGRWNLNATLDVQPGRLTGTTDAKGDESNYHYFSFLPRIDAGCDIGSGRRVGFSYSGSPTLPSFQQLMPLTNLTNPQYPITGNPYLKMSYTHKFSLEFQKSDLKAFQYFGYGALLSYSQTDNTIAAKLSTPKTSSPVIQATTFANAGTTNNFLIDYHCTLPSMFRKRLKIMLSGNVNYLMTLALANSMVYPNKTWMWSPALHLQYLIPNVTSVDLTAAYTVNNIRYPNTSTLSLTSRSASIFLDARQYMLHKWMLQGELQQSYTSNGARLQTVPANLNAYFQRELLPGNQLSITLAGYNLLNQSVVTTQTVTPTSITENTPHLTGRYLQLGARWKFQRFRR